MTTTSMLAQIDEQRTQRGFLPVAAVVALAASTNNVFLDPFSTLIGTTVQVGHSNVFYPNVVLEARRGGTLTLGYGNCFYPQTFFRADCGEIIVGDHNIFGEGGVSLGVSSAEEKLTVGNAGRYSQQAVIKGANHLGSGSQVLGSITVQTCRLEDGGSFLEPDPNLRGGVLKGCGLARGEVISTRVLFDQAATERQETYHPK